MRWVRIQRQPPPQVTSPARHAHARQSWAAPVLLLLSVPLPNLTNASIRALRRALQSTPRMDGSATALPSTDGADGSWAGRSGTTPDRLVVADLERIRSQRSPDGTSVYANHGTECATGGPGHEPKIRHALILVWAGQPQTQTHLRDRHATGHSEWASLVSLRPASGSSLLHTGAAAQVSRFLRFYY